MSPLCGFEYTLEDSSSHYQADVKEGGESCQASSICLERNVLKVCKGEILRVGKESGIMGLKLIKSLLLEDA